MDCNDFSGFSFSSGSIIAIKIRSQMVMAKKA